MGRFSRVLLFALSGCVANLQVNEEAVIACGPAGECPYDLTCSPSLNRCVRQSNNQAPSLVIGNIERSLGIVSIPVTVSDPESDPVDLILELRYLGAPVRIEVSPS